MGEPRPPPGAPVLLLVLSLAGGGQEDKATFMPQKTFPDPNLPADSGSKGNTGAALGELKDHRLQEWPTRLKKLLHLWERLPTVQPSWARGRRRRAVFLPRPAPSGTEGPAAQGSRAQGHQSRLTPAQPAPRGEEDSWKPADPARRSPANQPAGASVAPGHPRAPKRGMRPALPSTATEVGTAHEAGCRCPDSRRATVVAQGMEARQGGLRVPTPRTEEAAWAASALTFLLVLLTLAVLYTRLHRKCRRGPSLYWMTSSEEGRETVAGFFGTARAGARRTHTVQEEANQQRGNLEPTPACGPLESAPLSRLLLLEKRTIVGSVCLRRKREFPALFGSADLWAAAKGSSSHEVITLAASCTSKNI